MKEYFYIDNNNVRKGPVAGEMLLEEGVVPTTPVWCDGMADWTPAGMVDELSPLFRSNQAAPPFVDRQGYGQNQAYGYNPQQQYGFQQSAYGQNQQYGYGRQEMMPPAKPDSWLAWSILCTLLCCLPLGVVGIVYAAQVDSLWNQGRFAEAVKAAKKAKTFTLIGVISAGVIALLYFIFWIFVVALGVGSASMAGSYYY